jgi:hypothetical protein
MEIIRNNIAVTVIALRRGEWQTNQEAFEKKPGGTRRSSGTKGSLWRAGVPAHDVQCVRAGHRAIAGPRRVRRSLMASHHDWLRIVSIPVAAVSVAGQVQAAQYLTVEQAQQLMFGKSASFERNDLVLDKDTVSAIQKASGVRVERNKQPLWEVHEGDRLVGYFIIDEVYGKHEFITYAVALSADGRVRQIEVLVYRESYGYEIRNPAWRAQFIGMKNGDPVTSRIFPERPCRVGILPKA